MADDVSPQAPTPAPFAPQIVPAAAVPTDGNIAGVPQEAPVVSNGGAPVAPPPVSEPVVPLPEPAQPEPPQPPADLPAEPVADSAPPADNIPPAEGGDKSPLEILEDILASAGAEKEQKEKEEAEKKALEEQEKAEMAAKEAEYKKEAEVKISEVKVNLEEAQQQREAVDAQQAPAASDGISPQLEIHQLQHDKTT